MRAGLDFATARSVVFSLVSIMHFAAVIWLRTRNFKSSNDEMGNALSAGGPRDMDPHLSDCHTHNPFSTALTQSGRVVLLLHVFF